MPDPFSRTRLLYGEAAMDRLRRARVAVFGLGGVGGYVVEALARSGIGALDLIDNDRISLTNLNRQLLATRQTLGLFKVDAARERIAQIHPDCLVRTYPLFFTPETGDALDFTQFDYVVDAIDTVTGKLELAVRANATGTPIISAMGAGNKLDPTAFQVSDLYETSVCPLARIMRRELKKRGVDHLKVVWSREVPLVPQPDPEGELPPDGRRQIPGSNAVVPAVAGLILAGEVLNALANSPPAGR